jgi:hypothetical protein
MPRASKKGSVVTMSSDSAKMSDTAPLPEDVVVSVEDKDSSFAAGASDVAIDAKKPKGPKASRRAKTCDRCDERRKREREYARVSRDRARVAKLCTASTLDGSVRVGGDIAPTVVDDPSKA